MHFWCIVCTVFNIYFIIKLQHSVELFMIIKNNKNNGKAKLVNHFNTNMDRVKTTLK